MAVMSPWLPEVVLPTLALVVALVIGVLVGLFNKTGAFKTAG